MSISIGIDEDYLPPLSYFRVFRVFRVQNSSLVRPIFMLPNHSDGLCFQAVVFTILCSSASLIVVSAR